MGGAVRQGEETGLKEDEGSKDMKTVSTKGETGSGKRMMERDEG